MINCFLARFCIC